MFKDHTILALIPARGGSKGIPRKNIIDLCGKPLIAYSIEAARNSKYIDYVFVSTDDEEIANVAKKCGAQVPFMRPAEYATDTSKTSEAVNYSINKLQSMDMVFSDLIILQPTSPLRTAEDIDGALEKYYECGCIPLASVSEVDDHPILIRSIENDRLIRLLNVSSTCRRQDMPKYYRINGAIYIKPIEETDESKTGNDSSIPYIMDKNNCVDIDEISDLAMAEYYLNKEDRSL